MDVSHVCVCAGRDVELAHGMHRSIDRSLTTHTLTSPPSK